MHNFVQGFDFIVNIIAVLVKFYRRLSRLLSPPFDDEALKIDRLIYGISHLIDVSSKFHTGLAALVKNVHFPKKSLMGCIESHQRFFRKMNIFLKNL